MPSRTVASLALVLGGVLWLIAGRRALRGSGQDVTPLVTEGLMLVTVGILLATKS